MKKNELPQRIKFYSFSNFLQVTALRVLSEKEYDAIKISVYGYTEDYNHIEFSYMIEFKNERDRDLTFEEIKLELLFEDIEKIVKTSNIPIILK